MTTTPSVLEQIASLGYTLLAGRSRFTAAMSMGVAVYAQDQVGTLVKFISQRGVVSATEVAPQKQLGRSWFQVLHKAPAKAPAADLLEARTVEAEKRFLNGEFGYGYESSEPWFEEDGLLIKVIYAQQFGKRVQLEARVDFVVDQVDVAGARVLNITEAISESPAWVPMYSKWRHGGFYVHGITSLSGGCGCVSNNYQDGKWRIVCDPRRNDIGQPGDFTFKTRNEAAHAERALIREQFIEMLAKRERAKATA